MRFVHGNATVESASTSFHLSRKAGGYLSFGVPNMSRYQGFCNVLPWAGLWELFKSVEAITIQDDLDTVILHRDTVERVYRKSLERFSLTANAMVYDLAHYRGQVTLTLDMRMIHDFTEWGRAYDIQEVPGGHLITYRCPAYSFCLAVLGARGTTRDTWRKIQYAYDERRHTRSTFHVYDALEFDCTHGLSLRFGVGWTAQDALSAARDTQPQQHDLNTTSTDPAFRAAVDDLDGLIVRLPKLDAGIMAGYPWFYQVYTRDEAISTGALIALGQTDLAKQILLRELSHLHTDGRIGNRFPQSEIASADGVGWAFLRLHQLFEKRALSSHEVLAVHRLLGESLRGLEEQHSAEGLITNGWQETWMDTTGGYEDGRAGARIEIQGLSIRMYQCMAELCAFLGDPDEQYYRLKAELLTNKTRERFLGQDGVLADGIDSHVDRTIRPNIFIAAYAAPDLLSPEQWRQACQRALEKLWLPWGGLSTIDREHLLFTPEYSGENDRSYHRGDSWYFLNNIAAIVLHRYGFTREAQQIYAASKQQLLTAGIPGHAAETSSAARQDGVGCWSQAWSAATFVELASSVPPP